MTGIVRPEEAEQEIRELQSHAWTMAGTLHRLHGTRELLGGQLDRLVAECYHVAGRIKTNDEAITEVVEEIDDTRRVLTGLSADMEAEVVL